MTLDAIVDLGSTSLGLAASVGNDRPSPLWFLLLVPMVLLCLVLPFCLARRGPKKIRSEHTPLVMGRSDTRDNDPTFFGPSGHYDHVGDSDGGSNAGDLGGDD